jgi:hypothetical protein
MGLILVGAISFFERNKKLRGKTLKCFFFFKRKIERNTQKKERKGEREKERKREREKERKRE